MLADALMSLPALTVPDATADSSDESSDRFTDASEGRKRAPSAASDRSRRSPIPITRVERLDDEPAYGEVPGTAAYKKRAQDAVPDEVEVITRSRSQSRVNLSDRPVTPAELPIPKIIAMKIDPDVPGYGDVPGTDAYDKRRADAVPDMIVKSPDSATPPDNPWQGSQSDKSAGRCLLSFCVFSPRLHFDGTRIANHIVIQISGPRTFPYAVRHPRRQHPGASERQRGRRRGRRRGRIWR
jgi:hypothetical protein